MSYPTYDSYKDSGVEWLGEVPSGWDVERLKINATVLSSNVDKKTIEGELPVRLCNYTDVYYHDKITAEIDFMEASAKSEEIIKFTLCNGDVVITKDSETPDDIGVPTLISEDIENLICGYHLAILRGGIDEIFGPYLFYAINSELSSSQFAVMANGVTRFGLSYDAIKNVLVVKPPMPKQKSIAAFLDEKTSAIDGLIAKKEKLLELLAEKRTALITQAVTKGLDQTTLMKPSGIDWLGDVPREWKVKKLKYLSSANDEALLETSDADLDINYVDISSVDLIEGIQQKEEMTFSDAPSRARRIVKHGDTIVSTVRTYLKAIAAIKQPEKNLIVSTGFCVIRPSEMIDPDYLGYCLRSEGFVGEVVSKSVGVSYPAINPDGIMSIKIICPPLNEQKIIANYLCQSLIDLDAIKIKVISAISTLKEYRTALITNAVTGKIKVV